jgi:transcription initiation factor TFIIIB Brf1 subunit/transcription initiation factor TFIIB
MGGAAAVTGADLANKKSKAQGKLEKVCMLLSDSCRSLHLDERVAQVGFTIADSASTEGALKGKAESVLVAAILYLACKHCGVLKSIAEVCSQLGTNKFEVGRVINDISRKVKALEAVVFSPEEVVDKYGGQLRLPLGLRAAAVEVMKAAREVGGFQGMHPQTLAGAALLLLSNTKKMQQFVVGGGEGGGGVKKEEGEGGGGGGGGGKRSAALAGTVFPPPARSVGEVTGATLVGVGTMKKAHALLYEHRERVVPSVYAAEMASHLLELSPPSELDS